MPEGRADQLQEELGERGRKAASQRLLWAVCPRAEKPSHCIEAACPRNVTATGLLFPMPPLRQQLWKAKGNFLINPREN